MGYTNNQENDLESFFLILDLQKGCVKLLKPFLKEDKEKMIRNQHIGFYLTGLKSKVFKSKQDYKVKFDRE